MILKKSLLEAENQSVFLRNVKITESFFCACDSFTIHNINIVIYNIKSSIVSKIKKKNFFPPLPLQILVYDCSCSCD